MTNDYLDRATDLRDQIGTVDWQIRRVEEFGLTFATNGIKVSEIDDLLDTESITNELTVQLKLKLETLKEEFNNL